MTNKKYTLIESNVLASGKKLYRIKALVDFSTIKAGQEGGLVQSEDNLAHEGDCWITPLAKALHQSRVSGNALLLDRSKLLNNAQLQGEAMLYGNANAYKNAVIRDDVHVCGHTAVGGTLIVRGCARITNNDELMTHIRR